MARDLTLSMGMRDQAAYRRRWSIAKAQILHIASREHDQIVPQFGWAEQRPLDWSAGVVASIRATLLSRVEDARDRIAAVCACGQMHGAVLVDGARGPSPATVAPLWNDQRTRGRRR